MPQQLNSSPRDFARSATASPAHGDAATSLQTLSTPHIPGLLDEYRRTPRWRRCQMWTCHSLFILAVLPLHSVSAWAQTVVTRNVAAAPGDAPVIAANGPLDPSRSIAVPRLVASHPPPLPEQYIWTKGDAAVLQPKEDFTDHSQTARIAPHYFRHRFSVSSMPRMATIYIAGPRSARVYVNGRLAADLTAAAGPHMVFTTLTANVQPLLHVGENVLAIEAVRGHGSHHHTNSLLTAQLNFGEVLAVKIVPAAPGIDAPALTLSNSDWRSVLSAPEGWEKAQFDDTLWPHVQSLGSLEGSIDFFQWNADAGLYAWPGYLGEAAYMANYTMAPLRVEQVGGPQDAFANMKALTGPASTVKPAAGKSQIFSVKAANDTARHKDTPALLLDFGREVTGRVELLSNSGDAAKITLQYGESLGEVKNAPFLGVDPILVPAHSLARGPKSAFRYAIVRFPDGGRRIGFRAIRLDGIYYPVSYHGSFVSSDKRLNRIWEVGAYTAHLNMLDSVWDGAKRDRGQWMGDLEVTGRVIEDVFAESDPINDVLAQLAGPGPVAEHVNTLAGYSAFWVVGLANYARAYGATQNVRDLHARLLELLAYMDKDVDGQGLFADLSGSNPFVDWSEDLSDKTPESLRAVHFEYVLAYREAAWLLRTLGDSTNANHWEQRAEVLTAAAQNHLLNPATHTFGDRWQTNAMAVLADAATEAQKQAIWSSVLSSITHMQTTRHTITPYYGDYVLQAMAATGHRSEALDWILQYWGGMLDEGATSFWEAYDPSWPKDNFHAYLQADGKTGYYVSLAHGWSSGPTAWLMQQILGVRPTGPGYSTVTIRPDLAGLQWARGAVPTPHGPLGVDISSKAGRTWLAIDLPADEQATVLVPVTSSTDRLLLNGVVQEGVPAENGSRIRVSLHRAGHYIFTTQ